MKFYVAGFGHRIEKTKFISEIENHLLSYYYIVNNGCQKTRFEFLKKEKENADSQTNGSIKRSRKRKKRTRNKGHD